MAKVEEVNRSDTDKRKWCTRSWTMHLANVPKKRYHRKLKKVRRWSKWWQNRSNCESLISSRLLVTNPYHLMKLAAIIAIRCNMDASKTRMDCGVLAVRSIETRAKRLTKHTKPQTWVKWEPPLLVYKYPQWLKLVLGIIRLAPLDRSRYHWVECRFAEEFGFVCAGTPRHGVQRDLWGESGCHVW